MAPCLQISARARPRVEASAGRLAAGAWRLALGAWPRAAGGWLAAGAAVVMAPGAAVVLAAGGWCAFTGDVGVQREDVLESHHVRQKGVVLQVLHHRLG